MKCSDYAPLRALTWQQFILLTATSYSTGANPQPREERSNGCACCINSAMASTEKLVPPPDGSVIGSGGGGLLPGCASKASNSGVSSEGSPLAAALPSPAALPNSASLGCIGASRIAAFVIVLTSCSPHSSVTSAAIAESDST